MIESPGVLLTVASFFLVIGPLIFVHELGHYFAGRAFGVKAEAFSIGFGREIVGWTDRRGTRWKIGLFPLGGYVKFAGDMSPASTPDPAWAALPPEEKARTFQAKPLWQRFIIVAAGPVTNFVFAILVFAAFFAAYGEPRTPNIVESVVPGSAAEKAGVRPGDRVTMIARQGVSRFEDIAPIVRIRPGEPVRMDVYRDERQIHLTVTPDRERQEDRFGNAFEIGRLGVGSPSPVITPLPAGEVVGAAVRHTKDIVVAMVSTLGQIITGRRSVSELGGPLQIAKFSGQTATLGWLPFVEFMAMISINLGFINLLPIPLLDGGHLFFYALEAVRRRPLNPVVQEWAFRSGLALLLAFMLFVTFNDLASLGLWSGLAGLID
ncbi:MAG: RIP metalloprotease RseP [Sphingomonas sp.]